MRPDLGSSGPGGGSLPPESPQSNGGLNILTSGIPLNYNRMAGRAVAKVVHRCEDATEDQKLDLSDCQLMHVPDGVYHLMRNTTVLRCNLSANVIKKIPSKFVFKFGNIRDLDLSHNQLSNLPDELAELSDLQRLDISSNHYQMLPKVIFKLPRLERLNANKNYIASVEVARLSNAPSLREVDLRENPLLESTHAQLQSMPVTRITVHLSAYRELDDDLDDLDDQQ